MISYPSFRLVLEAHNPSRNLHRFYEIRIQPLLFEGIGITRCYGRRGTQGQQRVTLCQTLEDARQCLHDLLTQRLSAPRRLGCPYRPLYHSSPSSLTYWLAPRHREALALSILDHWVS
jgi:predicted DNA-binding WGR domain protein